MVGNRVIKKVKVKGSKKKSLDSGKARSKRLRSAILFSGGKDSALALFYALKYTDVKCLIIIESKNPESYMFHTPNIRWAKVQAKAAGIPCIVHSTKGNKEEELKDLKSAIKNAKIKYEVQSIVTGAIESVYQASRVQTITNELGMECFNPLWQKDQLEILDELIKKKFEVIIGGIAGEGFDKSWLGRTLDEKMIHELMELNKKYGINPAFEGGEAESMVLNAPFFKKRLMVKKAKSIMTGENSGYYDIEELDLV